MKGDRDITGMICSGIGRLEEIHIYNAYTDRLRQMGIKAFGYLDSAMIKDYDAVLKNGGTKNEAHLTPDIVNYLYARTFWKVALGLKEAKAFYFWIEQAYNHTQNCNLMEKAMLVCALNREDEQGAANRLWRTIDSQSLLDKETGIYWKDMPDGPGFHERPIETVCMLIEAYNIILRTNMKPIEEMCSWLIQHKSGNAWPTNTETADAVYALLLRNNSLPATDNQIAISIGGQMEDLKPGASSSNDGYLIRTWNAGDKKPDLDHFKVENKSEAVEYGLFNLSYSAEYKEDKKMDFPMKMKKGIFVLVNINPVSQKYIQVNKKPEIKKGEIIVGEKTRIKKGGIITVRIELDVDKDIDYICISDSIPNGFDSMDDSSKWINKDGTDYTSKIQGSRIHFYLAHLTKGNHVIEYIIRATQSGTLPIGIATIKPYYAPEYERKTKPMKLKVKE
jgi:hypothetical protein